MSCGVVEIPAVSCQFQISLLLYQCMVPMQPRCRFIYLQSLLDSGYSGFLSHGTVGGWICCTVQVQLTKKSITSGSHINQTN